MLQSREHIINELHNISPSIAFSEAKNVYSVPNAYFDELAGKVLQRVLQNYCGLSLFAGKPATAYELPKDYFKNLAEDILQKIDRQNNDDVQVSKEMETIAPFLLTISKQMPYEVPANYFNGTVTIPITASSNNLPHRPVLQLKQYVKYAVAAAVIGIIAITASLLIPPGSVNKNDGTGEVSVAAAVKNATDNEIIDYLNKSILVPDVSTLVNPTATEAEIDDWIKGASDDDIKSFLNDHQTGSVKKNKEG